MPVTYRPGSVGLVSLNGGYAIAELRLHIASGRAKLLLLFAGGDEWVEKEMAIPLLARGRQWTSVGVISHGDRLWWFDPSCGLLSCNPVDPEPALLAHSLPPGRVLQSFHAGLPADRCVCECDDELLFAEITRAGRDSRGREEATVSVWRRIPNPDGTGETAGWSMVYEKSFEEIWNDDSYKATQLPARVPGILLICPSNGDVIYFVLEQRIFGVMVPDHRVVEFVTDNLAGEPVPLVPLVSSLDVLPWVLPHPISDDLVEEIETFEERCGSTKTNSGELQFT